MMGEWTASYADRCAPAAAPPASTSSGAILGAASDVPTLGGPLTLGSGAGVGGLSPWWLLVIGLVLVAAFGSDSGGRGRRG